MEKVAGDWYGFMEKSQAQMVIPMHFEVWENMEPGFAQKTFSRANEMAEEKGLSCRMMSPERAQWYRIWMTVEKRRNRPGDSAGKKRENIFDKAVYISPLSVTIIWLIISLLTR